MKYISIIIFTLLCGAMLAQSDAMPYQTVLTSSEGDILSSTDVEVRLEIVQDSPSGTVTYSESHLTKSGFNGEINLELGTGTTSSSLDDVDWTKPNYIKMSYKPERFNNFFDGQSIQLLSVPYAMFTLKVTCDSGCDGIVGPPGAQGDQGPTGPPGGDGATGPTGPTGDQGPDGDKGISGAETLSATGSAPSNPSVGTFYLDNGSNTPDGTPGIRIWNGNQWLNL